MDDGNVGAAGPGGEPATLRRLLPDVADEPLDDLYLELAFPDPPEDRPHVYLDMVASVDGAASVAGRTRALGGPADRIAFARLREWCDLILVGAGTVRAERYGPARRDPEVEERRGARGLEPVPRIAVVTRSGRLEPDDRLFSDAERRPIVLVPGAAPHERVGPLADVADVVTVGEDEVDLGAALAELRAEGVGRVLCEGGPTLNGRLIAAGLVDEVFLTVAPQLVGTSPHRILHGGVEGDPLPLELREMRAYEGELLLRYRLRG